MGEAERLPEFAAPPLQELVLGVQYNDIQGYQQVFAGDVWRLFKGRFPHVQEQPPLPPTFETFGVQSPHINFQLEAGPSHDRFWFLSESRDELIQFQQDRLFHNWRRTDVANNKYPRFENVFSSFKSELDLLNQYYVSNFKNAMSINQCELAYVNVIPVSGNEWSEWITVASSGTEYFDDAAFNLKRIIRKSDGRPHGRLICDIASAATNSQQRVLRLALTVRGAPLTPSIESGLEFLRNAHELIVKCFAEITTEKAHLRWGRTR